MACHLGKHQHIDVSTNINSFCLYVWVCVCVGRGYKYEDIVIMILHKEGYIMCCSTSANNVTNCSISAKIIQKFNILSVITT